MGTNHQVETIVDITLDSTSFISKADITQRSLGIRFEYALPIFNTIEDKSSFYLGISYEPYIFSYQAKTQNFYSFPEKYFELSTVIAVVPRFTQYITKNCFLDLNVPIPIFGFSGNRHTVSNPILPIYTKSQYGSSSTFFPSNYQVRLGLGLRF